MILDSIHRADGISLFDGAMVLGAIMMELGVIYGFVLEWGPIIWGLIGLLSGAVIGFLLDYFYGSIFGRKKKKTSQNRVKAGERNNTEVILTICCDNSQYEMVEKVLWDNMAFGVGKLDRLRTTIETGAASDGKETA